MKNPALNRPEAILGLMTATADKLLQEALHLDEGDRAAIAGALIESLHQDVEPGAEGAWDTVIKQRLEELDSGAVETIPWSKVREQLFRGYE